MNTDKKNTNKVIGVQVIHPVGNHALNRNDLGQNKTTYMQGIRGMLSSQSCKKPLRERCSELLHDKFGATLSRQWPKKFKNYLVENGFDEKDAEAKVAEYFSLFMTKVDKKSKGNKKTKEIEDGEEDGEEVEEVEDGEAVTKKDESEDTKFQFKALAYLSDDEVNNFKEDLLKDKPDGCDAVLKQIVTKNIAAAAMFGRMFADDNSFNVDGAMHFSDSISTHVIEEEQDYFTAVDELSKETDTSGAGHLQHSSFNTAVFYKHMKIDIDDFRKSTKGVFSEEELGEIFSTIISEFVHILPTGKKRGKNAESPAQYVMINYADKSCRINLANVFYNPIKKDFVNESIRVLNQRMDQVINYYDDDLESVEVLIRGHLHGELNDEEVKNSFITKTNIKDAIKSLFNQEG